MAILYSVKSYVRPRIMSNKFPLSLLEHLSNHVQLCLLALCGPKSIFQMGPATEL